MSTTTSNTNTDRNSTKARRRIFAAAIAVAAAVSITACGADPDQTATVGSIPVAAGLPAIGGTGPSGNSLVPPPAAATEVLGSTMGFNPALGPGSTSLFIPEIEPVSPFEAQDGPGGHSLTIPVPDAETFDAQQGPGSNSL